MGTEIIYIFFFGRGGGGFNFFLYKGGWIGFHQNWKNEDKASCALEMDSLKITAVKYH